MNTETLTLGLEVLGEQARNALRRVLSSLRPSWLHSNSPQARLEGEVDRWQNEGGATW